ncbi:redoxin domain-containing protein [Alteromonas sp. C1M14]|uniref:redoxin domain-containing protein n=1 Tax=Alteromonas sp. C1M14 TaxID=2841567 RepID=UPI001C097C76|nr:redoxin domain-containing protein [Alteromonas sp. C1M14]MBU2979608.1 redoxin domain-containing protein [Alteromonas sp. C1M14]
MTNLLIVSNIILWIVLIVLTIMLFALVRQIGVLYERVAPAGALSINKQLKVGDEAPAVDAINLMNNKKISIGGTPDAGKCQLMFFVSPTCPMCKSLIPIAKSIAREEQSWVDLVFATDGSEEEIDLFIKRQKLEKSHLVNSELVGKAFGVAKLPYAVLIDEQGTLQAMGIVNSREHIESLFNVKETGYASLQEYMQKNFA